MKQTIPVLFISIVLLIVPIVVSAQTEVIYTIDGMAAVTIQNIAYRVVDGVPLTMDIYYQPELDEEQQLPVVIIVNGFRDSRLARMIGSDLKDTPLAASWGRLLAASGLIAINFESEQPDDLDVLVTYIRENAESLHIDSDRVGLMASSSSAPTAIAYAMQDDRAYIMAATFYYGSMTTPDGQFTRNIDRECRQIGCYGPSELAPIAALRDDLPTLVVRVGRDNGENPSIDHYVDQALEDAVPLTFINFPQAAHGFDGLPNPRILHEAQTIIAATVDFMIEYLTVTEA